MDILFFLYMYVYLDYTDWILHKMKYISWGLTVKKKQISVQIYPKNLSIDRWNKL